jgi:hypothetical protein
VLRLIGIVYHQRELRSNIGFFNNPFGRQISTSALAYLSQINSFGQAEGSNVAVRADRGLLTVELRGWSLNENPDGLHVLLGIFECG